MVVANTRPVVCLTSPPHDMDALRAHGDGLRTRLAGDRAGDGPRGKSRPSGRSVDKLPEPLQAASLKLPP